MDLRNFKSQVALLENFYNLQKMLPCLSPPFSSYLSLQFSMAGSFSVSSLSDLVGLEELSVMNSNMSAVGGRKADSE